jgi:uncharacterized protein (DUF2252 family)
VGGRADLPHVVQGDLHAENFGTYMDGSGVLIFDVNDFDEAFVGHFTWDLERFAASVALMCWQKALSDEEIKSLIETFVRAYVDRVRWFVDVDDDSTFSLNMDTARGAVLSALQKARLSDEVADAGPDHQGRRLGPAVPRHRL